MRGAWSEGDAYGKRAGIAQLVLIGMHKTWEILVIPSCGMLGCTSAFYGVLFHTRLYALQDICKSSSIGCFGSAPCDPLSYRFAVISKHRLRSRCKILLKYQLIHLQSCSQRLHHC